MAKPLIKLYFDILSPFTYLVFHIIYVSRFSSRPSLAVELTALGRPTRSLLGVRSRWCRLYYGTSW